MIVALNLLWLVPPLVWWLSKKSRYRWRNAGFTFGSVVLPASTGLYGLYFVGPCIAPIGCLGGAVAGIHTFPVGVITGWLDLPKRTTVDGNLIQACIIGSVFWAIVYGVVGLLLDSARRRKVRIAGDDLQRQVEVF